MVPGPVFGGHRRSAWWPAHDVYSILIRLGLELASVCIHLHRLGGNACADLGLAPDLWMAYAPAHAGGAE